jgi:anaerobic selenocysteine-containing dehydrogenase
MTKNKNIIERIPTVCGMCGPDTGCGLYAQVQNGKFIGVEGMKESPINLGKLCPKAYASMQWVYSPQRLKSPLKRTGAKGEGKFAEISWAEAIDIIANKLMDQKNQFGPESLAILSPARRSYSSLLYRFLMTHGSPNYAHSGICAMQRAFCFSYTFGSGWPMADYKNADLVMIWGKQPVYSSSTKGGIRNFIDAKARGTRFIAIKPSIEPDAAKSDIWVPIRPGTDSALALAMLHVIINENLYDAAFVSNWCYGFDDFKKHVQQYPPSWAETITGVPQSQIEEVARLYATAKSAAIDAGNGLEHAPSASDAIRAIAILMAITGNLDRKGGNLLELEGSMPMPAPLELRDRHTPALRDKLVGPEFPTIFQPFAEGLASAYFRVMESVLTKDPYQIKTIIAPGTQPLVSTRGSKKGIQALKEVDFFVTIDVMKTAELPYADIVMPVASSYETEYPFENTKQWIGARRKVIEPLGDYKSMHEFWLELGVKMGYGQDFWDGDINRCMDYLLEPFEISFEELKTYPHGKTYPPQKTEYQKYEKLFASKSPLFSGEPFLPQHKVALRNTRFEAAGFSAFPNWVEPQESPTATPELLADYPLVFSDYHASKVYNASWLRNIPLLREIVPYPTLHINPDTARERGISEGDEVIVESPHGVIKLKAQIIPGIRPDTVMALHGWWQGCEELDLPDYKIGDGGANTNNMYATEGEGVYDPLITAMSSQTLVQVRKA